MGSFYGVNGGGFKRGTKVPEYSLLLPKAS